MRLEPLLYLQERIIAELFLILQAIDKFPNSQTINRLKDKKIGTERKR